jgi:hypothetical protein
VNCTKQEIVRGANGPKKSRIRFRPISIFLELHWNIKVSMKLQIWIQKSDFSRWPHIDTLKATQSPPSNTQNFIVNNFLRAMIFNVILADCLFDDFQNSLFNEEDRKECSSSGRDCHSFDRQSTIIFCDSVKYWTLHS